MRRLIPIALAVWLAAPGVVLGQERTMTVEVGKTKCVRLKRAVERHRVEVEPAGVARGRFDTDANRLCVEGQRRGDATVTFTGSFRRIVVGSDLREEARPFEHTLRVRVLPPEADRRTVPKPIEVEPGKPRRIQLSVFMPPTFGRRQDENESWRQLGIAVEPRGVVNARTLENNGRIYLQIAPVRAGRAQIRLTGERRVHGDWQEVVRVIDVRVP